MNNLFNFKIDPTIAYAKKMILKTAVSIYPEGRKKLNGGLSQFSNFADTAVLLCTAE